MKILLIYILYFVIAVFSCSSNKRERDNNLQTEDHQIEYVQDIFYQDYKIESKTYYYNYNPKEPRFEDTVIIYPIYKQTFNLYKDNSFVSEIKFPVKSECIKVDTLDLLRYYISNVGFDKVSNKDVIVFYGASNNDYITEFLGATDLTGEWISYHIGTANENLYQYNRDFFFKETDSYSLNKLKSVLQPPQKKY